MNTRKLIAWYYWLTPIFALVDGLFGYRVRVAEGIPTSVVISWYVACLGLAFIGYRFPQWQSLFALVESAANIAALMIGFYTLHVLVGDVPVPPTSRQVLAFALSGGIGILAFHDAHHHLRGSGR